LPMPLIPQGSALVTTPKSGAVTMEPEAKIITIQTTTAGSTAPATTTTSAPGGSSVGAAPAQPATTVRTGDLQQPYGSTNSYTFYGAGSMRVTATWPTSPTLSLTVVCPASTQTAQGSSFVSVLLPVADGACEVTLKELVVQYDAVSYRLTIAPSGG
jgi:hypothetical protein